MTTLQNDRFIQALLRQPIDRTPIWMMRQAGRYLPEYRAVRAQAKDFFSFCQTPELACEVTLQPIKRFGLDAAIIFSDILTVPLAMGCDIHMHENRGPIAVNPISNQNMIDALQNKNTTEKLDYVAQAIKLTKKELNNTVPLIGFAGSPWTVATYMVEGQSSKTYEKIKAMMYRDPKMMHDLLQKITDVTVDYLNMQIQAGADVIMIFDSWGGVLSPHDYQLFSLNYMTQIGNRIFRHNQHKKIPLIFFSKGCGLYLENMINSGCDAIGLDWTMDLNHAKKMVRNRVALQGNLDPCVLLSTPEKVRESAREILKIYNHETGFVFNLGHGISKDTPIENVEALIETVKNL